MLRLRSSNLLLKLLLKLRINLRLNRHMMLLKLLLRSCMHLRIRFRRRHHHRGWRCAHLAVWVGKLLVLLTVLILLHLVALVLLLLLLVKQRVLFCSDGSRIMQDRQITRDLSSSLFMVCKI